MNDDDKPIDPTIDPNGREINKPMEGSIGDGSAQTPITPEDVGETSSSGETPALETDDDTLDEVQSETGMYTEYSDNHEGEVSIADQLNQAEDVRRKGGQ